jgi:hypothetical protein
MCSYPLATKKLNISTQIFPWTYSPTGHCPILLGIEICTSDLHLRINIRKWKVKELFMLSKPVLPYTQTGSAMLDRDEDSGVAFINVSIHVVVIDNQRLHLSHCLSNQFSGAAYGPTIISSI